MNEDEDDPHRITLLLRRMSSGDREAQSELMPIVYAQLLRLAERQFRGERRGHTLQPTAIVSELYLRVLGLSAITWRDRQHFFAVSATTIRRILVDHARAANAQRRPNPKGRLDLDDVLLYSDDNAATIIDFDDALQTLEARDPRMARVVEMRVFGGWTTEEIAASLGVSERTVKRDWSMARAWLSRALT